MKKCLTLLLIVSLSFISCDGNRKLHSELQNMANMLNMSVPVQLDSFTYLIGVSVDKDNRFKYIYEIRHTDQAVELIEEAEISIQKNIKEAFRTNPDLKILTDNQLNVDYIYQDSTGKVLKTIQITPEDYK